MKQSLKLVLALATDGLTQTSPSARADAEILLMAVLNQSRTFIYAHPDYELNDAECAAYQSLLLKRASGIPIAYLTGTREFWSLPLRVSADTLIPRPETELLVELTLSLLKQHSPATVLDLGTGSGAIALALASERPDWQLLACDKSQAAVDIARDNAMHLGIENVRTIYSDWFSEIHEPPFNAIIANPPYIAENDPHLIEGDLRFEPRHALVSGMDGLDALSYLIQESYAHLLPDGLLLLEHGYDQGAAVTAMLNDAGYQRVQCWPDWQGHDRISGGFRQ